MFSSKNVKLASVCPNSIFVSLFQEYYFKEQPYKQFPGVNCPWWVKIMSSSELVLFQSAFQVVLHTAVRFQIPCWLEDRNGLKNRYVVLLCNL